MEWYPSMLSTLLDGWRYSRSGQVLRFIFVVSWPPLVIFPSLTSGITCQIHNTCPTNMSAYEPTSEIKIVNFSVVYGFMGFDASKFVAYNILHYDSGLLGLVTVASYFTSFPTITFAPGVPSLDAPSLCASSPLAVTCDLYALSHKRQVSQCRKQQKGGRGLTLVV